MMNRRFWMALTLGGTCHAFTSGTYAETPAKDPFAGEPVPIIPGQEEKLRKPYADILTPYDGFREQHPCAKGKSVEELAEQWGRGASKVEKMLKNAKPSLDHSKYMSIAEAARYLNRGSKRRSCLSGFG
jgi:hypothetical protein